MYDWSFDKKALKELKNLDKPIQIRIVKWLDEHIQGTDSPRVWGKALEGDKKTLWRYRVGKYRLIVDINDHIFNVLVLKTAKRNEVYQNK
ncbi:type II toxin-antitoxin system RelE/ParE family toxin [Pediococcus argentinicus]|uniref:type II toxin-antitoxin system RelE family toxin n=1 Tax=Pediococcus argentinicus TaxID=480391 RepID=UPI00338F6E72